MGLSHYEFNATDPFILSFIEEDMRYKQKLSQMIKLTKFSNSLLYDIF